MELSKKIQNYFNAAISAVFVTSLEDDRVREEILDACKVLTVDMWLWTPLSGFVNLITKEKFATKSLGDAFKFMREYANADKPKVMFVMQDFHLHLSDKNPVKIDDVKLTVAQSALGGFKKMMIAHGADMSLLPNEIQHLFKPCQLDLPDREDLLRYAEDTLKCSKQKSKKGDSLNTVTAADAACGMTKIEAVNAFALSLTKKGCLDPAYISEQKAEIIKKLGILEIIKHPDSLDRVGGLKNLKAWLMKRKCVFDSKAREYGIPSPGGVLIVGVPGCLAGDTEMFYLRGKRKSGRRIRLDKLHAKFNGKSTNNRGWVDLSEPTYLHSLDPDTGRVFYNRVVSVIDSGIKDIVYLYTAKCRVLGLTADHPVLTVDRGYVAAGELKHGDALIVRGSMKPCKHPVLHGRKSRVVIEGLKYYPSGWNKTVGLVSTGNGKTYSYQRQHRARLVYEAHMNGVSYQELVCKLKTDAAWSRAMKLIPDGYVVHHIDENPTNDALGNLCLMAKVDHDRHHTGIENMHVEYTKIDKVVGIVSGGMVTTFDVQMEFPCNNFAVGNGLLVHNTGKSLTAKCAGATFQRPIIRLDMGRLFGGVVGASEANTRKAIETIDAVSPCVLWIDEIEKGMSGTESSGKTDGGTGSRVFGTLLTWMQEHKTTVFPIATANDVSKLPPELIRRFDEIFTITLPSHADRVMIWEIIIKKYKRDPQMNDVQKLATASQDYTGAEIEKCVVDALYAAYEEGAMYPSDAHYMEAIKLVTPIASVMPEKIAEIIEWSRTRARPASDDHDKPRPVSTESYTSQSRIIEDEQPF